MRDKLAQAGDPGVIGFESDAATVDVDRMKSSRPCGEDVQLMIITDVEHSRRLEIEGSAHAGIRSRVRLGHSENIGGQHRPEPVDVALGTTERRRRGVRVSCVRAGTQESAPVRSLRHVALPLTGLTGQ